MILQENSQCLNKAPNKAFSFMKAPTSAFTMKYLLRHYAELACKHGIKTFIGISEKIIIVGQLAALGIFTNKTTVQQL